MKIVLDRRSLLKLCGGALALSALPRRALSLQRPRSEATLVLVDRRYRASIAFAEEFAGADVEVLPVGRDLARLWRQGIAPRIAGWNGCIEAVTLPADLFGLECLADGSGAVTEATMSLDRDGAPRRDSPAQLLHWRMRFGGEARLG